MTMVVKICAGKSASLCSLDIKTCPSFKHIHKYQHQHILGASLYKTMLHSRQTLLCTLTMLHSRLFCDIKAICERTIDPCYAPTPHRRLVSNLLPTFVRKICARIETLAFLHILHIGSKLYLNQPVDLFPDCVVLPFNMYVKTIALYYHLAFLNICAKIM